MLNGWGAKLYKATTEQKMINPKHGWKAKSLLKTDRLMPPKFKWQNWFPRILNLKHYHQRYPLFCFQYILCSSHGTCDWPALEFKLLDLDYLSFSWLFPTLEYDFIKIAGFMIMLFKKFTPLQKARTIRLIGRANAGLKGQIEGGGPKRKVMDGRMDWGQIFQRWSSSKQKG